MADKNLSLGTVFTGRVDEKFENAVRSLLAITRSINKEMGALTGKLKGTSTGFSDLGTATTTANKALKGVKGQAEVLNKQIAKVQGAWARLKAAFKVTASYGLAAAALFKIT